MTVATTGQKTILVIEDDPWTRTITTALLAGEGVAALDGGAMPCPTLSACWYMQCMIAPIDRVPKIGHSVRSRMLPKIPSATAF